MNLLMFPLIIAALSCANAVESSANYFLKNDWYKRMGWCSHQGSQLLIGDFNGDGRADLLCHDNKGYKAVALANEAGQFTGTSWHKTRGWCAYSGLVVYIGDFNGDGRSDMLCLDSKGNRWVSLADVHGRFSGTTWHNPALRWCGHNGVRLLIGDFNGDGRSDLMCYDGFTRWISLAGLGGIFPGTSSHKADRWCSSAGSSIQVADVNGDGRDDLVCHEKHGRYWVMFAQAGGIFNGITDWHGTGWCSNAEVHLGYFNGDRRADVLCHNKTDGYEGISTASSNVGQLFVGTSWHRAFKWCGVSRTLYVADFNNDGNDDLLCHEQSSGKMWIAYNHYPRKGGCSPNQIPCHNGGQCISDRRQAAGNRCQCKNGYSGNVCQLDPGPDYFKSTDWYKSMGWCRHIGSQLLIGDFNGDGRADMLCHDNKGYKSVALANEAGQFTGTSWHKNMGWCYHAGSVVYIGDFNGDGRSDMLCHDSKGHKVVSLADVHGRFSGTSWYNPAFRWCGHQGVHLLIGDFNGDGRSDMLCYDGSTRWISLAGLGGIFPGTSSHKADRWCSHAGSFIQVADVNGDGRDDLVCHEKHGRYWVMFAQAGGIFSGISDWVGTGWCSNAEFHLGYFNGDRRADMLCHRKTDGYKWISTASSNVKSLFSGTSWHRAMNWCGVTGTLYVADFNNDGNDDLLCHEQSSGKLWIAYNHYP